ncbi:MAG TPA: hypothetical protein VFN97_09025 [Actinospica sp.]|nr:hypothetical protein [Actinospica sp.]
MRTFRRHGLRIGLAALGLPAVLALAGCGDTANAAAPALAVATGAATDSAAVHAAVCSRVESAWAAFVPQGSYSLVNKVSVSGRRYQVYKINYGAYRHLSAGLYQSLTGNREYRLTYDIDVLAAAASDVANDPASSTPPKQDLATLAHAAPIVAEDCGTTLELPA